MNNLINASSPGVNVKRKESVRSKFRKHCRTSKQVCQEKLACHGVTPAKYRCEECKTLQCEACENLLHETTKFLFHDRIVLSPPASELLCQENCINRNFADVTCVICNRNFCFDCESLTHSARNKSLHQRVPFELPTPDTAFIVDELEEFYSSHRVNNDVNEVELSSTCSSVFTAEVSADSTPPGTSPVVSNLDSLSSMESQNAVTNKNDKRKKDSADKNVKSFPLIDDKENLKVSVEDEFLRKLQCSPSTPVKVVSIFGNTGEGKSHTLNHTFYNGYEVFHTSQAQASCTIGVWVAYNKSLDIVTIDTEGLLGFTSNENQRTRLLLKVLAVSDIVIYRTRAERLHNDLFHFLGDASQAYSKHFTRELRAASQRCRIEGPLSILGPTVLVFHETLHTEVLTKVHGGITPEENLKYRFKELGYTIDAFSALEYVGTRTAKLPTDFTGLFNAVKKHLCNSSVRSARKPAVLFQALKVFSEKFSGDIEKTVPNVFPDQYFTCSSRCLSCQVRCENGMNHCQDDIPHCSTSKCVYQHQHDNRVFTCKSCYERGHEIIVVPKTSSSIDSAWMGLAKYAWSGYVLECPYCGVIFRSRQYWYGNRDPVETVVRTEIRHVWPGETAVLQGTHNAAQKVIDSVKDISSAVANVGAKPTKMLTSWMADQIAPAYWIPNADILDCGICKKKFSDVDAKHHCRSCGGGFCEDCSSKTKPVPERGWGNEPVRVCDKCYHKENKIRHNGVDKEVTARKVGEVIQKTLGSVKDVIDVPIEFIKDSARPTYWISNHELTRCFVCKQEFSIKLVIHHCRACGQGVCDPCSTIRRPVPSRGWDQDVRVCSKCDQRSQL